MSDATTAAPAHLGGAPKPRDTFRADIQALRALAVLSVVAYHAGLPVFHGGFLGVDVFFVVSGFVITNVLLKERARSEAKGVESRDRPTHIVTIGLALVASVVGLATSIYLLVLCQDDSLKAWGSGAMARSCRAVLEGPSSKLLGIPTAALGVVFFIAMVGLSLPPLWRSANRHLHVARATLSAIGFGVALYLVYVQVFITGKLCLWCLIALGSALVLLAINLSEVPEVLGEHRTSLVDFYGRRIRRILPAATVVIIATVFCTYHWLAYITGGTVADDAKWVTSFVGNFHFAAIGTNYFTAQQPPSTLQQFWSLAVEEQFYLVWPLVFIVVGLVLPKVDLKLKLLGALVVIMASSLIWSIYQTDRNATLAFFSPFTRAWELGLGAALAVASPWMLDKAPKVGSVLRVVGLVVIGWCIWHLHATSQWPGKNSILPVVATGLVLAGGTMRVSKGYDRITSWSVIQWVGLVSYSLYLVHWPILQIAEQYSLTPLSSWSRFGLVENAIVAAAVLYYVVENPIRRARFLTESRWLTLFFGAAMLGVTFWAISWSLGHPMATGREQIAKGIEFASLLLGLLLGTKVGMYLQDHGGKVAAADLRALVARHPER